jgi:cell division protein YceG involved in septum cleavage
MTQVLFIALMSGMLVIAIWIVFSIFSSRVSEPSYERVAVKKGYEIRTYEPFIEATTTVNGSYKSSLYEGFRIVGGYIFGNNAKQQSISMTAPVLESKIDGKKRRVSFVMPEGSKMDELPQPQDSRVKLQLTPSHTVAVLRFNGLISAKKIIKKEAKLLEMLKRDNITIIGKPRSARYDPPGTFPLIARNEILVMVTYKK